MKRIAMLLFALVLSVPAFAQKSSHADMANQGICYQQAKQVVDLIAADDTKYSKTHDEPGRVSYGTAQLDGAHYDSASKTCYVKWSRMMFSTYPSFSSMFFTVIVADAFEGKDIATFHGDDVRQETGGDFVEETPVTCQVNGTQCDSRAQFNGLLWKLIPAFRPVNAHN